MKPNYNELYYQKRYINPIYLKFGIQNVYYLWTAFFCIIRQAKLHKNSHILDFGCGIGNLVWALRKIGRDAVGIDSATDIKKLCRIPSFCSYRQTKKLPFENRYFDLIYSNEVLEHIKENNLRMVIKELDRVSRGRMIHMICVAERGKICHSDPTHVLIKDETWWKRKFESFGYKVDVGNLYYFFPNLLEVFKGQLKISGVKKGYFYISKINAEKN